ncbi:MAG: glutathione peroxidase [Cryomorphaceae bacterium]|jgi:glutathione peroxidase
MKKLSSLLRMSLIGMLVGCGQTVAQPVSGPVDFYSLSANTLEGEAFSFEQLRGKRVLIVNTASECGFTPQYKDLQALWEMTDHASFVILGFPCNDFGNQESGTADEIQSFCSKSYGVTFQMMEKVSIKGVNPHPVYQWLTQKEQNGNSDAHVRWNFCKFAVNETGQWNASYLMTTSPLSKDIKSFAGVTKD